MSVVLTSVPVFVSSVWSSYVTWFVWKQSVNLVLTMSLACTCESVRMVLTICVYRVCEPGSHNLCIECVKLLPRGSVVLTDRPRWTAPVG